MAKIPTTTVQTMRAGYLNPTTYFSWPIQFQPVNNVAVIRLLLFYSLW